MAAHSLILALGLLERMLPMRWRFLAWKQGFSWVFAAYFALLASGVLCFASAESPPYILCLAVGWCLILAALAFVVNWRLRRRVAALLRANGMFLGFRSHYRVWQNRNGTFALTTGLTSTAALPDAAVNVTEVAQVTEGVDAV